MKKILQEIFGERPDLELEYRFFTIAAFLSMFFCFIVFIFNLFVGFEIGVILFPLITILFVFPLFLLVKYKKKYRFSMNLSIIFASFFLYPYIWFYNGGSSGTIPFFLLYHSILGAIFLNRAKYKLIFGIQLISAVSLFIIEHIYPNSVTGYENSTVKFLDVTVWFTMVFILVFFTVRLVLNSYNQKLDEIKKMHEKCRIISITDSLTGIYNRGYILEILKKELDSKSLNKNISVFILDIDFFKKVNDTYGHGIGDKVIIKVCNVLKSAVFKTGNIGRIGGEEFLIILPNLDFETAKRSAEILIKKIENLNWEIKELKVTISCGVYSGEIKSLDKILEYADRCLYQAKKDGRNCVRTEYKDNGLLFF